MAHILLGKIGIGLRANNEKRNTLLFSIASMLFPRNSD
jgi:hypothetical protein